MLHAVTNNLCTHYVSTLMQVINLGLITEVLCFPLPSHAKRDLYLKVFSNLDIQWGGTNWYLEYQTVEHLSAAAWEMVDLQ
jgi:hypothetical protein